MNRVATGIWASGRSQGRNHAAADTHPNARRIRRADRSVDISNRAMEFGVANYR